MTRSTHKTPFSISNPDTLRLDTITLFYLWIIYNLVTFKEVLNSLSEVKS